MNNKRTLSNLILILFFIAYNLYAQVNEFIRIDSILVPEIEDCGFGEIIAGVDFDGDNLVEIYVINNMQDEPEDIYIPRIYKFEYNGVEWEQVWDEHSRDILKQNSWAPMTYGDWDKDGKQEIIWSPANFFTEGNENPPRIMVWEANGDDILGRANFGFQTPSAQWTITDQDNFEVRPFRLILNDIDGDNQEELIFCDRQSNYRFGVISISDVPDNGNGSEVWTLETSALENTLAEDAIYDMAIIGNNIYLIHSNGSVTPVKYENNNYTILDNILNILPGGSWKSSNVVDLDNDGQEEIVIGGWQIDATNSHNKVFLLQEDETNILKVSQIANYEELIDTAGRINGGHDAVGDLDNNGYLDFIFGTRGSTPATAILRMEYLGGEISDSNNYQISIIDSLYPTANPGRYDIVSMANLDDDPELEVLYTNGATCEKFPIVILDPVMPVSVKDDIIPTEFVLDQNYPNPFNPTTTISFSLPEDSNVELKIFNSLGQESAVLISEKSLSKGNYNYKFNAASLASGVYIYTLNTNFGKVSKKMVVIK